MSDARAADLDGLNLRPPLPQGAQAERVTRDAQYLQAQAAGSGASAEELARKLSNPVSSLISVPFQYNLGVNAGDSNHGWQHILNVQPVIPIELNQEWNLIVRTIVQVIYQDDVIDDGGSSQIGFGDTTQSFFLSPANSDPIWGVGPVIYWPSGTNDSLGQEQWGLGITGLVLKQHGPWTWGVLANHIWSVADHGGGDRPYISTTFLQPFLAHNNKHGFGVTIQAETSYDWNAEEWTVPVGLFASQVFKFGGQHMQANLGPRVWLEGPDGAPEWGVRFTLTFLFPR
jgi:hypothetical protein